MDFADVSGFTTESTTRLVEESAPIPPPQEKGANDAAAEASLSLSNGSFGSSGWLLCSAVLCLVKLVKTMISRDVAQ